MSGQCAKCGKYFRVLCAYMGGYWCPRCVQINERDIERAEKAQARS
jgi:phage FluMu protein Com